MIGLLTNDNSPIRDLGAVHHHPSPIRKRESILTETDISIIFL